MGPALGLFACTKSTGSRLSPGQRNTATHKIHLRCNGNQTASAACVGSLLWVGNPTASHQLMWGPVQEGFWYLTRDVDTVYFTSSDPDQSWKMTDFLTGSFSRTGHIFHSLSNHILLNLEEADTQGLVPLPRTLGGIKKSLKALCRQKVL